MKADSVFLAGGTKLAAALRAQGVLDDPQVRGLVYDASASDPSRLEELENQLMEVFSLTQQAVQQGVPIVYVLHEPSIWGHSSSLRARKQISTA